uniref:Uncharacterized protein n=1 Tax=Tetraselmis sp. GSL018 TaxID=582737 RepID=A0A061SG38_9CHLO
MDSAKQKLYFPAAKGFRFAGGSSKIYVGAKDLDVEEISGSFLLTAETECSLDPVCGEPTAHLTLTLGGASMLGFESGRRMCGNRSRRR